jgi:hypothetical protein
MPHYFFVNHTVKEICSFNKNIPVLQQLEMVIAACLNWHKRHIIVVEADQSSVYRLVDTHQYVILR